MKSDLCKNPSKIDDHNTEIDQIENKSKINEDFIKRNFEEIRQKMSAMEDTVTTKVVEQIKPKISEIQSHLNTDLSRIVKEELSLQKYAAEKEEVSASESPQEEDTSTRINGEPEEIRNKKQKIK